MSEVRLSFFGSPFSSRGRRRTAAGLVAATSLAALAACSGSEQPKSTRGEAHFSVVCPSGGNPAITEVAHSGALPREGDKFAGAVVRLACSAENETPVIVQDTERGGACLGYGKETHLVVGATRQGSEAPEFFVAEPLAEIGVVGTLGQEEVAIRKAELHHHDLDDSLSRGEYQRNNCGTI